ncbi:MAG TPA: YetF domain-containing protein [Gemmatimonadaceae bacterium]|nr:YetF domain-containing protein [Gemmatimonadaceae bacterium]
METVVRILVIYLLLLLGLRAMGKREFGQLSPFELVTLLLIPELIQQAGVREDFSLTNAVIAVSTLFLLVFLTSALAHRFSGFEQFIAGSPAVLAHDGRFLADSMNHERVSAEEVYSELRKVGLVELKQVRWVLLEPDGRIAVIPRRRSEHSGRAPEKEAT